MFTSFFNSLKILEESSLESFVSLRFKAKTSPFCIITFSILFYSRLFLFVALIFELFKLENLVTNIKANINKPTITTT
jgi:hypothetical protein